jgi:bifunctional non-homologous end joining protein LigD
MATRRNAGKLAPYNAKRDFSKTAEPRGGQASTSGHSFVIQKHAARRLHYDFRLELDGVLKSWAVTRGPSLVPGEKRLAVHVEDHPLDYAGFEGTIPQGQYGGGTVLVWDRGTWEADGDPHRGLKKGHLDFALHGEKLSGRWHLVRMAPRRGEKNENWLLLKADDEAARADGDPDILEEAPQSVASGRTIEEIADGVGPQRVWDSNRGEAAEARAAKRKASARTADPPPVKPRKAVSKGKAAKMDFLPPELATLAAHAPEGEDWVHEIKFDGYRIQAHVAGGAVRLFTRKGLDWTEKFQPIADALAALDVQDAILDGEIVVENAEGASDFAALQETLREGKRERFVCYLFDCLRRDGRDFKKQPLRARKDALRDLISTLPEGPVRYSEDFTQSGEVMLKHACQLHLEGIVSKRADAPYRSGRVGDWVKTKCAQRQEFVIGGFTRSRTGQAAIGSLILGVREGGRLVYAGRTGTGFSSADTRDLWTRLNKLKRKNKPFAALPPDERRKDAIWVEPELVCEVEFRSWTADKVVRHAAFKGLREDKAPEEIVAELPVDEPPAPKASKAKAATAKPKTAHAKSAKSGAAGVKLTHPDRVYWPEDGITKQMLADFYDGIWEWIAPHVIARPLALIRCPDGIGPSCFFQKHSWTGMNGELIHRTPDPEDDEELLSIDSREGLIALVQAGVLEIHPWGSTLADIERPDRLIFDLDPGPGVDWPAVIAAAHAVRDLLGELGLASFVKTSGGKGLHVVAPLTPRADWSEAKEFSHALALLLEKTDPARYIANMAKARRKGRIFVDYLRNGRGATAVAAYSTRGRPGAAISTPITWDELTPKLGPAAFTLKNLPARLKRLKQDPWAEFEAARKPLPSFRE